MQKQRKKQAARRDLSPLTPEERKADKKAYMAQWRSDNKKHVHDYHQERYWDDPDHYRKLSLDYYRANPEECKERFRSNYDKDPAKNVARVIAWAKKNPEKKRASRRANYKKRYSEDPSFRIACSLKGRLTKMVRLAGAKKFDSTFKILGCSLQDFMIYLESKFEPWMTWDNYGEWHVDHIMPLAIYDLTKPDQQKIAFHFSNLQPLRAIDNLRKNKFPPTPALGTEPQLLTSGIDTTCPLMGET